MSPTLGDIDGLREVLIRARTARGIGASGRVEDRLLQESETILALRQSIDLHVADRALWDELCATLRCVPTYATDATMGSEPVARHWVVWHPLRFHRIIEKIKTTRPSPSEFPGRAPSIG